MTYISEIAFIDPTVDDVETIVRALRPQVKPVVLDRVVPAARQIAQALDGLCDLDAVHVIAHGEPGQVHFCAGELSAATILDDAKHLAAIGRALAEDGELRLWSCGSAAGAAGTEFMNALAQATGADICAATGRVGAANLGGTWALAVR